MKTPRILTVAFMAGGLIAFTGLPSNAQHSSGGTPPSVTEGKGGDSGKSGSGSQGERHDSVNKKGQAESSGKMSPPERMEGSGSGSSGSSSGSGTGTGTGSSSGSGSGGK
jgi:hypothetical protein